MVYAAIQLRGAAERRSCASLALFSIYVHLLAPGATLGWALVEGCVEQVVECNELAFADDLLGILLYTHLTEVLLYLQLWRRVFAHFGFEMSVKTIVLLMWVSRQDKKRYRQLTALPLELELSTGLSYAQDQEQRGRREEHSQG